MAVDARKNMRLKIVGRLGIGLLLGGIGGRSSISYFSSRPASDLSFEVRDSSSKEV
jgi:hypothetical protein